MSLAENLHHPIDKFLRVDRIPHIFCPGCGIGNIINAYAEALEETSVDLKKVVIVSGIGCAGRVAGYVRMDSFHTTHGRAIPFAIGLKLANPELRVSVISGDGDLFAIGGNHFIHAARRNINMLVICSNNFIYGMTGGQLAPTTPLEGITTTSPYGNFEHPFNLVHLAAASGATYVARWTSVDVRRLTHSIVEAFDRKGFRFIEVLSPCPVSFGKMNKMSDPLELVNFYQDHAVIRHGEDPAKCPVEWGNDFVVGKFVDAEKETFQEARDRMYFGKVKS